MSGISDADDEGRLRRLAGDYPLADSYNIVTAGSPENSTWLSCMLDVMDHEL